MLILKLAVSYNNIYGKDILMLYISGNVSLGEKKIINKITHVDHVFLRNLEYILFILKFDFLSNELTGPHRGTETGCE